MIAHQERHAGQQNAKYAIVVVVLPVLEDFGERVIASMRNPRKCPGERRSGPTRAGGYRAADRRQGNRHQRGRPQAGNNVQTGGQVRFSLLRGRARSSALELTGCRRPGNPIHAAAAANSAINSATCSGMPLPGQGLAPGPPPGGPSRRPRGDGRPASQAFGQSLHVVRLQDETVLARRG